jgi:hypothetical protein
VGLRHLIFNDGIDQLSIRSFRTWPMLAWGGKQEAVLSFRQHLLEMQQSEPSERWRNGRHAPGEQSGDDTIAGQQVGSALSTAIEDAQLMFH